MSQTRPVAAAPESDLDRDERRPLWWYARIVRSVRPQGGRLFNFGCGGGALLKRLSRHFETFGYDPTGAGRSHCRTNAPDAVILEEWASLPDGSFDVIVAERGLEQPRTLPTVERLTAKLTSGGVLLIIVPNPGGLARRLKGRHWFAAREAAQLRLLTLTEWLIVLRKAGLMGVRAHGDGLWDVPYVWGIPTALQRALFELPAAVQVTWPLSRPLLPPAVGECLLIIARKP